MLLLVPAAVAPGIGEPNVENTSGDCVVPGGTMVASTAGTTKSPADRMPIIKRAACLIRFIALSPSRVVVHEPTGSVW